MTLKSSSLIYKTTKVLKTRPSNPNHETLIKTLEKEKADAVEMAAKAPQKREAQA